VVMAAVAAVTAVVALMRASMIVAAQPELVVKVLPERKAARDARYSIIKR